ncbi:MAG: glucose-6-phosphate isomerase [Spirochaetia bacterium]|nr:glucose-6-phosphate isomerase [Spirochaetia bacterium]
MSTSSIKLDYGNLLNILSEEEIFSIQPAINECHNKLYNRTGSGSDYLGWVTLPKKIREDEISEIQSAANFIRNEAEALIVIGIGGSYLGAKAVIEALSHSFYNSFSENLQVFFAGHHLDSRYHTHLFQFLENKKFAIIVISKSGTTTEPAIAFRFLKNLLEKKIGKEKSKNYIFTVTDKDKGALKKLSILEGYKSFVIPDDVGGRYSVFTPVGLLPIAAAGIDITEFINGAIFSQNRYEMPELENNSAYFYAACRNLLYRKNKKIEILINYSPALQYVSEWWRQLFGESEGKDHKGIFPASCSFTTDLHSMGQWIQNGERTIFETILEIEKLSEILTIEEDNGNLDNLNFLVDKDLGYINGQAMRATAMAHLEGGVPNMKIKIPELNAFHIGGLLYFFEKACGLSGYLLGVNPFNQPGVEDYKRNMFALLKKPGFEKEREELLSKMPKPDEEKIV